MLRLYAGSVGRGEGRNHAILIRMICPCACDGLLSQICIVVLVMVGGGGGGEHKCYQLETQKC